MSIEWDEARFGTGFADIDAQHQEWIRQLNRFEEAVASGLALPRVRDTLAFLVNYTDLHFTTEEATMKACNCPALPENRLAHEKFLMRMNELIGWAKREPPTPVEVVAIKHELEDWVTRHISTIDIRLRDYSE